MRKPWMLPFVCAGLLSLQTASGQNPDSALIPPPNAPYQMQRAPVAVTGRVLLADGVPSGSAVPIIRVCDGVERTDGYTDSDGNFSISIEWEQFEIMEGSKATPPGDPFHAIPQTDSVKLVFVVQGGRSCHLEARLPGYQSDAIDLMAFAQNNHQGLTVIFLHRAGHGETPVVSAAALAVPKAAKDAFAKGEKLLRKGKPEEARPNFENAARIDPSYAAAWVELGKLAEAQKLSREAEIDYRKAIQADPAPIEPYLQIGALEVQAKDWRGLAATSGAAIKLDPAGHPLAFFFNAVANYNLMQTEAAEKSASEAVRLDAAARYPLSRQLLGLILASRGDYAQAAVQMRAYLELAPQAPDAEKTRAQVAQCELLAGSASARPSGK